jgi:hypothetical protein
VTLAVCFYDNIKQSVDGFHQLFRVEDCAKGSKSFFYKLEIWKRFLDHNKELVLINWRDESYGTTEFFIKVRSTKYPIKKVSPKLNQHFQ